MSSERISISEDPETQTRLIRVPMNVAVVLGVFLPEDCGRPTIKMGGPIYAVQLLGLGAMLDEHGRVMLQDAVQQERARVQREAAQDPAGRILVPTGNLVP